MREETRRSEKTARAQVKKDAVIAPLGTASNWQTQTEANETKLFRLRSILDPAQTQRCKAKPVDGETEANWAQRVSEVLSRYVPFFLPSPKSKAEG
jgi:hypothetical protein